MMKVVYISGPITGTPQYWEAFEKTADDLTAAGFIALNPAALPEGMTNEQYMRINFSMIDAADAVLFLDHWEMSRGASLECSYCMYIGKPYATSIDELKEVVKGCRNSTTTAKEHMPC